MKKTYSCTGCTSLTGSYNLNDRSKNTGKTPIAIIIIIFFLSCISIGCTDSGGDAQSTPLYSTGMIDQDSYENDVNNIYQFANKAYRVCLNEALYIHSSDNGFEGQPDKENAEIFFMKPSSLKKYMLYDRDGTFLGVKDGRIVKTSELDRNIKWQLTYKEGLFTENGFILESLGDPGQYLALEENELVLKNENNAERITFDREEIDFKAFPEVSLNVDVLENGLETPMENTGMSPLARPNPGTEENDYLDRESVIGYADVHSHLNHFLGSNETVFLGKTFHPLGVQKALKDCSHAHGTNGVLDLLGMVMSGDTTHDTSGWPDFGYWPTHSTMTHQQAYYKWIERSWLGGQRVLVQHMVSNEALCELMKNIHPLGKDTSCNDMDICDLQIENMYKMQDYIDAQCGGPGNGWFRICTDSKQAREVIHAGKMAVFLALEFDTVFDADTDDFSEANKERIEEQIQKYYDLGIRSVFVVHAFNNGFAGSQLYQSALFNVINLFERGEFFDIDVSDNPRITYKDELGPISGGLGHENSLGLNDLGAWLINKFIEKGIIVEIDHLGDKSLNSAMEILWDKKYPGIIASHTEILDLVQEDNRAWEQIDIPNMIKVYQLGGIIAPRLNPTISAEHHQWGASFYLQSVINGETDYSNLTAEQQTIYTRFNYYDHPRWYIEEMDPYHTFQSWYDVNDNSLDDLVKGVPFATDVNGACTLSNPRDYTEKIAYGFGSLYEGLYADGYSVAFNEQTSGNRTFSINDDENGMAHYGLIPDMLKRLQENNVQATKQIDLDATFNSGEAYLRMLERVENYVKDPDHVISQWQEYIDTIDLASYSFEPIIQVYESENYEDDLCEYFFAGEYNTVGVLNDRAMSVQLNDSDYEIWLFQDVDFSGRRVLLRSDSPNLYTEFNLKNKLSSVRIMKKEGTGTPVVYCYNKSQFDGKDGNVTTLTVGSYTKEQLIEHGQKVNTMSSLRIDPGLKVTLYDGTEFNSGSVVLRGDITYLGDYSFNDKTASLVIEYDD